MCTTKYRTRRYRHRNILRCTACLLAIPLTPAVLTAQGAAQGAQDHSCPAFGPEGPDPETSPPISRPPSLINGAEAVALVDEASRPLQRMGVGGVATVWFLVDSVGRLRDVRLAKASGWEAVDTAALRISRQLKFAPATFNGRRVCTWFARPLRIGSTSPGG